MIKVGGVLPLGATGLSAKVVYELPFHNIAHFWNPPARLMVRCVVTQRGGRWEGNGAGGAG